ncbi:MAG: helix-turn-helix transcriptional regulator [Ruminococcaceae bacterium]|nr:helix-turn-helix transcriptional regulator [Oscillospiraceae bacterium]
MEFNEKLQTLRKQKGLTQEELASALYVSRTAISKWESGRGYPGIESLKEIAKFFSVTIDELLSCDEMLTIAEEDSKKKENRFFGLVFGLLDISIAMLIFLPFFGQNKEGIIKEVSLLTLTEIALYLKVPYYVFVILSFFSGVFLLATQNFCGKFPENAKNKISLILNASGLLLFIVSSQPYAAAFLFVLFLIKAMMLIKK